MKLNVKRICIFLALMLIAGSVFGQDILRQQRIGQYEISVVQLSSGSYVISIIDKNTRNIYGIKGEGKSNAMQFYNVICNSTSDEIRNFIRSTRWEYDDVHGFYLYGGNGY